MKKVSILLFLFVAVFQVCAQDCVKVDFFNQLEIISDSCISMAREGKVYLNMDKVLVDRGGIYLETDLYGIISLDGLLCDEGGIYKMGLYDVFMCNGCGRYYTYQPSECSNCGGTSFTRIDQLGED